MGITESFQRKKTARNPGRFRVCPGRVLHEDDLAQVEAFERERNGHQRRRGERIGKRHSSFRDLLLVALMELAHRNFEVSPVVFDIVKHEEIAHTAESLGQRLLTRTNDLSPARPTNEDRK
jgi:hypothetical protein